MRILRLFICIASVCLLLAGCSDLIPRSGQNADATLPTYSEEGEPLVIFPVTEPSETGPDERLTMTHLTTVVTERTIRDLENYPNLQTLDLSGSTCYTAILVYAQEHPQVEVTYTVDFGGSTAMNWAEDIILDASGVNYDLLNRNLVYLRNLRSLHLPRTRLTMEQIEGLRNAHPDLMITYTVGLFGQEFTENTETVNLNGLESGDFNEVARALQLLPGLTYVELMDASGYSSLTRQEAARLMELLPDVRCHYRFELFGRMVDNTDASITFKGLSLDESSEAEIRGALSLLAPGSELILDNCGLSNEFLASIRQDYTRVDLVWRVWFGTLNRYSTLTNDDTLRAVYNVTDSTCDGLRYCRSAKYIDMGHNDTLTDLSWLSGMPDLEILILSGCAAKNLDGIENCTKLEFLELANCYSLSDISALSGCYGLKYVNICFTKVDSLKAMDGLDIQNLFCKRTRVGGEEQRTFKEIHPTCTAVFSGNDPYAGPGWRYTDYGYTYTSFYKHVREVFDYDAVDRALAAAGGQG